MSWSEQAWNSVADWYDAILDHPFLYALRDGTLPDAVFCRYLCNDAHYLNGYARALSTLAARVDDPQAGQMFATSAAHGVEVERVLHQSYLRPRGVEPAEIEPSPTCAAYAGMVQTQVAYAPVELGLAAVLPCYRVYAEVGNRLLADVGPDTEHPYRQWLDTYADPSFSEAVREVESYVDTVAAATTEAMRERMLAVYIRATRYEWMFWDSAWRAEAWPTPAAADYATNGARSDGAESADSRTSA